MGGESGEDSSMGPGFGNPRTTDFDIGDAQVTLFGAVTLEVLFSIRIDLLER
ncbi:hypothetical protein K443DRAFT_672525 [Laccaria amethystina LaAM-08-1]|uniref:Uncharacterized protein n=1 Tax=Laccaria amethystina LaAM-08-1 TaxID=1095629 RepID=A0A0C9Y3T5_9AGAR|nr:hypothetical protein K443DRAFT_672525 [Laccaria amethystina LaAM-08-1]